MQLAPALALCSLTSVSAFAQESRLLAQQSPKELRGVRISAADGIFGSREQISKALEALADARFNVVFPCVWDGAYTLWRSPTAKEVLGAECDPALGERDVLSEILFEAHRFGLEVVPFFEAGFTARGALLEKHPDWAALGKDGKPLSVGGETWVDALNPDAQQFFLSLVLELARGFDIDGIAGSERFPALPIEANARPAQLELYKKASGGASPKDAKDSQWCAWRALQLSEFLGRMRGGLRSSLALVMAPRAIGPGASEWSQDYAGWSERGFVQALVLPAAQLGTDEWTKKHAEQLFAGLTASGGTTKATLATLRTQKFAGEVFAGCRALLDNNAALARSLADEPYAVAAIPPWRTEEGWRPKPLEARPQAGSGRWTFPASDGPLVMALDTGLKGEVSWSVRARVAGVYEVYAWVPPNMNLGETAQYQLATKRGLQTIQLKIGPMANRGWQKLGAVNLPENEEFEVARFEATEKAPLKSSAIGPLLLFYDRQASR